MPCRELPNKNCANLPVLPRIIRYSPCDHVVASAKRSINFCMPNQYSFHSPASSEVGSGSNIYFSMNIASRDGINMGDVTEKSTQQVSVILKLVR